MVKLPLRKFNIEMSQNDPFRIKESQLDKVSFADMTWDYHFERSSYYVKRETIKKDRIILEVSVENRQIINDVFITYISNFVLFKNDFNKDVLFFIQSFLGRMIKTSKIIQDLIVKGNYIESKSLLRDNFERGIKLQYFIFNEKEFYEYHNTKSKNDKKYNLRRLSEKTKNNYNLYRWLCGFVHPHFHPQDADILSFGKEEYLLVSSFNSFCEEESYNLLALNNNLLVFTFKEIIRSLEGYFPKKEIYGNIKESLSKIPKLEFIYESLPRSIRQY
ncbi:hypothetical protein GOV13_00245 [Candidatus Pacearchaeota archaeon]|nr:hypothetical protein [Candidatus Pacearchaeota archaeon]